eukprot:gene7614-biopygen4566
MHRAGGGGGGRRAMRRVHSVACARLVSLARAPSTQCCRGVAGIHFAPSGARGRLAGPAVMCSIALVRGAHCVGCIAKDGHTFTGLDVPSSGNGISSRKRRRPGLRRMPGRRDT